MTNKRYTDEEIVKALECCLCDSSECSQCQNKELCKMKRDELAIKTLDLIVRKVEEIERLNKKVEELSDVLSGTIRIRYAKAKSEAYKEFAERLKETSVLRAGCVPWYDIHAAIDYLLKEMVGEEE